MYIVSVENEIFRTSEVHFGLLQAIQKMKQKQVILPKELKESKEKLNKFGSAIFVTTNQNKIYVKEVK